MLKTKIYLIEMFAGRRGTSFRIADKRTRHPDRIIAIEVTAKNRVDALALGIVAIKRMQDKERPLYPKRDNKHQRGPIIKTRKEVSPYHYPSLIHAKYRRKPN